LLEEITGRPAVTWKNTTLMRSVIQGDEDGIIHLHGHSGEPEFAVLGTSGYNRIASEKEAQRLVEAVSYTSGLVLVGFGAPLDTLRFNHLRTWLTKSPGARNIRLVAEPEQAYFSQDGLVEEHKHLDFVVYGRDYAELGPFLQSLGLALTDATPMSPGLAPNPLARQRAALCWGGRALSWWSPRAPWPCLGRSASPGSLAF
jgi:hypothetical protein